MQADLTLLLQQSLQSPRSAARRLLDWQFPASTAVLAIALMAVISAGLTGVSMLVAPEQLDPNILQMFQNPLQVAFLQGLVMVAMAMLVQGIGRMFGGRGRLTDALVLIAWTEALLSLLQLGQIVLVVLSPSLAAALGLFGLVLFLWVLASFIAELHGFASAGKVLLGLIATVFVLAFAMAVLTVAVVGVKG
ncbi:YIP1 family protein [Cypionkella sp. TWP1-2-1b2]|uniref:YIP1 family protein n=1 Tax=Cypionkella sp. TWP1-2-1b2 TaxID=2804675 RepID=UPI003CF6F164